ncbi:hypothetical protein KC318_g5683 [Hortaea werneckii]|nr:hypothetical protein KC355_g19760 [Hortaea werneckii]KAI6902775.1 hypothetical protein KC334_g7491 [Hortaea werneckii]KAI7667745.1 hypothetical protein KC318_g5683 [Hortaea werneckii]
MASTSPFLRLAAELRLNIYEHATNEAEQRSVHGRVLLMPSCTALFPSLPRLLQVNRQLRREFMPIAVTKPLQKNTFFFKKITDLLEVLSKAEGAVLEMVHSVHIGDVYGRVMGFNAPMLYRLPLGPSTPLPGLQRLQLDLEDVNEVHPTGMDFASDTEAERDQYYGFILYYIHDFLPESPLQGLTLTLRLTLRKPIKRQYSRSRLTTTTGGSRKLRVVITEEYDTVEEWRLLRTQETVDGYAEEPHHILGLHHEKVVVEEMRLR